MIYRCCAKLARDYSHLDEGYCNHWTRTPAMATVRTIKVVTTALAEIGGVVNRRAGGIEDSPN